jgi:phosphatidyl-myo-inositol dimannoside synthase
MADISRPKILLVTRNLPPLVGGMERLNWHMANELSRYADVRVIGPSGSAAFAPSGMQVYEAPLKPLWLFLLVAQLKTLWCACFWRPTVILAGSGLMALAVKVSARLTRAFAVAYVHGLDIVVPHPVYQHLWLPVLGGMDRVIANSGTTARLANEHGIDASRIGIVNPGVDVAALGRSDSDASHFRSRHGLNDRVILLSLGRLSERKGLREFVASALPSIVERCPRVILIVVGSVPAQALSAKSQSPESIMFTAREYGVADHLLFLGSISDQEVAEICAAADVHIFPVRDIPNDPEGFGMVAVEAAAHGLPTVAFAAGGVVDAVSEGKSGFLVQPGDYSSFVDAVLTAVDCKKALSASARQFADGFSWPLFGERIMRELFGRADSSEMRASSGKSGT